MDWILRRYRGPTRGILDIHTLRNQNYKPLEGLGVVSRVGLRENLLLGFRNVGIVFGVQGVGLLDARTRTSPNP